MRPLTPSARFRRAALALLTSLASVAWAEPQRATVRVIDGDVNAARSEAVREILWNAGIQGNAQVQSQSALIDSNLRESTLIRTSFRLKRFQITEETITDDHLALTAEIEQEQTNPGTCEPSLPLQNIAYAWQGTSGAQASEADSRAGQLLGTALAQALQAQVGHYLQDGNAGDPMYRIDAQLELPARNKGEAALRLQLRTTSAARLIREIRLPAGAQPLARQEDTNLGYALLRQWVPTATSRQLADDAARQLAETIRCLPAVLRIPRLAPDGGFSLTTRFPMDFSQRGLVLFFSAWPVKEGGAVDLLQADGYLKPELVDDRTVQFSGGTRRPGKKHPTPGGYLLVL